MTVEIIAQALQRDKSRSDEYQYLSLVKYVIDNGEKRIDRTKTGTLSVFAPPQLRFNLHNNSFPLLTTKRVFLRGIFEELMFFIRGQTYSKVLSEKGVKIWDGNGSREYLDSIGLSHREEGDLGPVYGWQWRYFGAEYKDHKDDYKGQGFDQLQNVIDLIRNNPSDRRIILSAWNPSDLKKMALPPCHMFCQFYVSNPTEEAPKGRLSCQMYQRSCDLGLGVPFNIASYSLLTVLLAHITGLELGEFILTMGDAHVYLDHIEPLKSQLEREPRSFPKLIIKRSVSCIEDFQWEDIEVVDYQPHPKIAMTMSV